jgi:hypothetical protein
VTLEGLVVADEPATWAAIGFAIDGDRLTIGGVTIVLAGRGAGEGIVGWSVAGLQGDALPRREAGGAAAAGPHPNGVVGVDHVVALAADFDAAVERLRGDGLEPRRIRDVPGPEGRRQAFYGLSTALLEVVGPVGEEALAFWGLTLVAGDLDALAARLGEHLGPVRDAVQPGRTIATLRRSAGVAVPLAFMSPR